MSATSSRWMERRPKSKCRFSLEERTSPFPSEKAVAENFLRMVLSSELLSGLSAPVGGANSFARLNFLRFSRTEEVLRDGDALRGFAAEKDLFAPSALHTAARETSEEGSIGDT